MKAASTFFVIYFFSLAHCIAQPYSFFQKILSASAGVGEVQSFDVLATSDGGYLLTGIGKFGGNVSRSIIAKLDCKAQVQWAKNFATSSTIGNVNMRTIECKDGGYCSVVNTGTYGAYNMMVVRVASNGSTLWRQLINNGLGDDQGTHLAQAADSGFVICGSTNSFGSEQSGAGYSDVYVVKLNSAGNLAWSKTYGNTQAIEQAHDIVTTLDGGFAITGKYIYAGAFFAMLLKLDASGNLNFLKCYGDSNHNTTAYAMLQDGSGNYYLAGSTTVLQNSFADYADLLLIKCKPNGDTIFCKAYEGSNPNSFENFSSIHMSSTQQLVLGVATASFPTVGIVPNKQVAMLCDTNGVALRATAYNQGGSHYTQCAPVWDGGMLLSGFTTLNSPTMFRSNAVKTGWPFDAQVCFTANVLPLLNTKNPVLKVANPSFSAGGGAVISTSAYEGTFGMTDSVLCEFYPSIKAAFTHNNSCSNLPITFTSSTASSAYYKWLWGNGDSAVSASNIISYQYPAPGTYTVTLIVSNGCQTDTAKKILLVGNAPVLSIIQNPNPAQVGDIVVLSSNLAGNNYAWNTGDSSASITTTQSGLFILTTTINGCVLIDTLQLRIDSNSSAVANIPSAITPNGDGVNDDLVIYTYNGHKLKQLVVCNRWGNEVFRTTDISNRWRGVYRGAPLIADVYYYHAVFSKGTKEVVKKGDVTLLR